MNQKMTEAVPVREKARFVPGRGWIRTAPEALNVTANTATIQKGDVRVKLRLHFKGQK